MVHLSKVYNNFQNFFKALQNKIGAITLEIESFKFKNRKIWMNIYLIAVFFLKHL